MIPYEVSAQENPAEFRTLSYEITYAAIVFMRRDL